ncbi:hypothetical protein PG994_003091 [Apiospora phragmitis]|uniref:Uncharacterized protein n=1 Tax=Apiospora phragmitis TaxID=2905665 RepID=A0ABR1W725_9PEZI
MFFKRLQQKKKTSESQKHKTPKSPKHERSGSQQQQLPQDNGSAKSNDSPQVPTNPPRGDSHGETHQDVDSTEDRGSLIKLELFVSSRMPARCAGCSASIELSAGNVTRSVQHWWKDRTQAPIDQIELTCGLYCGKQYSCRQHCSAITCVCGSKVNVGSSRCDKLVQIHVSGTKVAINHCCDQGRDLVAWALACATSQFRPSPTPWILSNSQEKGYHTTAPGTGYARSEPVLQLFHRPQYADDSGASFPAVGLSAAASRERRGDGTRKLHGGSL